MNPGILFAVLGNKKLIGSSDVVEAAAFWGPAPSIDLILNDERFNRYIPVAFSKAARLVNDEILHPLLRNHIDKIASEHKPALLKDIIVGSIDNNHPGNLSLLPGAFPHDQIRNAINQQAAEYCVKKKSWAALGAVMAYQFTEQPVIVSQLLAGLQMILPQLAQMAQMYKLKGKSSEVDQYLLGFWSTFDVLPADLKCNDWLMIVYDKGNLLLAVSDEVTKKMTAQTKPEDLMKFIRENGLD